LYENVLVLAFYDGNPFQSEHKRERKKRTDGDALSVQLLRFSEQGGRSACIRDKGQSREMKIGDA
jgi:hypothetical protein